VKPLSALSREKKPPPRIVGSGFSPWLTRNRKIEENNMKHHGIADCWHVKEKYDYKPEFGLHVYGDDWKWSDENKYRWRGVLATRCRP
jgi:hypothetical protein